MSTTEPPKAQCPRCKNGCYFINDSPCQCDCHNQKAQTVPELVRELYDRLGAYPDRGPLKLVYHKKLSESFPAIAAHLLSQEAEIARLRGSCDEFREAVLSERHQLAEIGLTADQINAILGLFDDTIGQALSPSSK